MSKLPSMLLQGLCLYPESALGYLDPFYAHIVHSYVMVNNIFHNKNKSLDLPVNLWGHPKLPEINKWFCNIDIYTVADLPRTESKRINYGIIQNKFHQNKISYSAYLVCYKLQSLFGVMSSICPGSHLVREELVLQSKALLRDSITQMLSLTNWEHFFRIMPISIAKKYMIFR